MIKQQRWSSTVVFTQTRWLSMRIQVRTGEKERERKRNGFQCSFSKYMIKWMMMIMFGGGGDGE